MQLYKPVNERERERESEAISLFALYSYKLKDLIPENLYPYPTFFADATMKKKKSIALPPFAALLGHPVQNIFLP